MYIGKLNERLQNFQYSVYKMNTQTTPVFLEEGNPFLGETMFVSWKNLISSGVDLAFSFEKKYRINRIVVHLNEKSTPKSVRLFTKDKKVLIGEHLGETGLPVKSKEVVFSVEGDSCAFVLEFDSDFSSIVLDRIDIFGAELEGICLFPLPKKIEEGEGSVSASYFESIGAQGKIAEGAAEIFAEKFYEETGISLKKESSGKISFSVDGSVPENGYRLAVKEEEILLSASDLRGMVYGAEVLLKLYRDGVFPVCKVEDQPYRSFRGVHLYLPAEEQMEFTKRLIKYVLSPSGYNYIIMEICGAMQFDSHPEINRAYVEAREKHAAGLWPALPHGSVGGGKIVSKAATRDLIDYAERFGIEVIPEIQSLGHVQFMTLAHPEIAERAIEGEKADDTDARLADVPPSQFYAHCFCPSNPKSYEILFHIADEIIDTFRPKKYVHMGHDEIYQIGVCPVCSKRDPADILAEDVNKLHDYLAAKGLKLILWGDMFQPVTKYLTSAAIDKIPKDILFLDFIWYFHLTKDIEKNLLEKGFSVAVGNLYSSHFPRYETRIPNLLGGEVSAWVETKEEKLQSEGKMYDFLYTANMLWSETYVGHCRYSYDRLLRDQIPHLRERVQNRAYPSLSKKSRATALLERGVLNPERGEEGCRIMTNEKFQSLVFEHCTANLLARIPWTALDVVGNYTVEYENGQRETVPVTYGGNVSHWSRRQNEPFRHAYYRHNGYSATWMCDSVDTQTADGEFATLYRYEWINPHADWSIVQVFYTPSERYDARVQVQKVLGIQE